MTTNEIILQAQITSLRRVADVLLLHFWSDAENKSQLIWFSRYLNYKYERDILASSDFGLTDSGQQPELLARRRYHLQVLMDIAYLQGNLGELNIVRRIAPQDAALANKVFESYDGFDESLSARLTKLTNRLFHLNLFLSGGEPIILLHLSNTLFLLNLIALTSKVSRYILIITHIFEHIEEISLHIVCNCA